MQFKHKWENVDLEAKRRGRRNWGRGRGRHSLSYRGRQVARLRGSKSQVYFTLTLRPPFPLTL